MKTDPQDAVSFEVTREEARLISKIVARVQKHDKMTREERLDLDMDITAVHANGCPLNLEKLLAFDDFNFWHDIRGIQRHIDRNTGTLTRCFVPRCAQPEEASS
jgi:hypothetical protein